MSVSSNPCPESPCSDYLNSNSCQGLSPGISSNCSRAIANRCNWVLNTSPQSPGPSPTGICECNCKTVEGSNLVCNPVSGGPSGQQCECNLQGNAVNNPKTYYPCGTINKNAPPPPECGNTIIEKNGKRYCCNNTPGGCPKNPPKNLGLALGLGLGLGGGLLLVTGIIFYIHTRKGKGKSSVKANKLSGK